MGIHILFCLSVTIIDILFGSMLLWCNLMWVQISFLFIFQVLMLVKILIGYSEMHQKDHVTDLLYLFIFSCVFHFMRVTAFFLLRWVFKGYNLSDLILETMLTTGSRNLWGKLSIQPPLSPGLYLHLQVRSKLRKITTN